MKITKTWHEDSRQTNATTWAEYSGPDRRLSGHNYLNPKPFVEVLWEANKSELGGEYSLEYDAKTQAPDQYEYYDMHTINELYPDDLPDWWQGVGLYDQENTLIWQPGDRTANMGEFTLTLEDE
jgi:hypothetical protein